MRSAILIFLAILTFATTPARAQGTWLERRMISGICSSEATPVVSTDRLASRLNLTNPQKAALKDLADASASADASAKSRYVLTSPIFLRRRAEWRSPKRWRRPGLLALRKSSPSFRRFMTAWTRSRRKRSTQADASEASSAGGARNKEPWSRPLSRRCWHHELSFRCLK